MQNRKEKNLENVYTIVITGRIYVTIEFDLISLLTYAVSPFRFVT